MRKGRVDLTGQTFGSLTVLGVSEKKVPSNKSKLFWDCVCKCGNTATVEGYLLVGGQRNACVECSTKFRGEIGKKVRKYLDDNCVIDGVNATRLHHKPRNKTGHTGIHKQKNGKFTATIGYKGKLIYLGTYATIQEAVSARKEAEEKYYRPIIEEYENRKKEQESQTNRTTKSKHVCKALGCKVKFVPHPYARSHDYCSDRCRWREAARRKKEKRQLAGLCPQCGKDMVAAAHGHPSYCASCQGYFADKYKQQKEQED